MTDLPSLYESKTIVRLTKLKGLSRETGAMFDTGYWVEGFFVDLPALGNHINLFRERRPRWSHEDPENTPEIVEALGTFTSSIIEKIDGLDIHTQNSIWRVSLIREHAP